MGGISANVCWLKQTSFACNIITHVINVVVWELIIDINEWRWSGCNRLASWISFGLRVEDDKDANEVSLMFIDNVDRLKRMNYARIVVSKENLQSFGFKTVVEIIHRRIDIDRIDRNTRRPSKRYRDSRPVPYRWCRKPTDSLVIFDSNDRLMFVWRSLITLNYNRIFLQETYNLDLT